jgi:copper homeostasis protein
VDSVGAALEAEALGADRIELCAGLPVGGLTPSAGAMSMAGERLRIPFHVLVLPRAAGYVLTGDDLEVMRRDIAMARAARAAGVVVGALREDGTVDQATMAQLIGWARPMSVTFHRAFDRVPDPMAGLDQVADLGVDRVLTAGGSGPAAEATAVLARLVARSAGAVTILAGGGIRARNVVGIVRESGVREVHARDITGIQAALAGGR